MYLSTLNDWLTKIGSVSAVEIELGLDRVREVAARLDLLKPSCIVITVGGTNGKGSTVAGLEAIYRVAGYHVGAFTSPILFKHNEYVRIDGEDASDQAFCEAYEAIESKRGKTTLTPFEYHTLAALWLFKRYPLDVMILEVGLGGRLDAVNVIDADVAVVTSISLDHTEWLGDTREKIGFEKAGIFRPGKPVVCGDEDPPVSLREYADEVGAIWIEKIPPNPPFSKGGIQRNIPLPINTSTILTVIEVLQASLPVNQKEITEGLKNAALPGRIQIIPGEVTEIWDVSHNPGSVALLAEKLTSLPCAGKTIAVFSMLADKDIASCLSLIKHQINVWYIAPLKTNRAASLSQLETIFKEQKIAEVFSFSSIKDAYAHAKEQAQSGDRIVIFGSFHTVAEGDCNGRTQKKNISIRNP